MNFLSAEDQVVWEVGRLYRRPPLLTQTVMLVARTSSSAMSAKRQRELRAHLAPGNRFYEPFDAAL